jgi:hypothetical protein
MTNDIAEIDLLQAARSEDLTYNQIPNLAVLGDFERGIVDMLKGAGAHLLVGARGVGKTMLLRIAESEIDASFRVQKKLAVYVNFKTSTLLEGVKAGERDGFQIWVGAKILQAVHDKLAMLDLIKPDDASDPYRRIFGIATNEKTKDYLYDKIHLLQKLALNQGKDQLVNELGPQFLDLVLDTTFVVKVVRELLKQYGLEAIVFFFDEAAHTFIPSQQEIFFEIFKLLHGGEIAVKAAVYPTVTSYGRNFEIGQDAIALVLDRFEPGGAGLAANRKLFRGMLDKRLPEKGKVRKGIYSNGAVLDLCIDLSSGNPRAFLHLLNRVRETGFSERSVVLATQNLVDAELLPYHSNLSKRLPKYAGHVRTGLDLLRGYIVPELRERNFRDKKSGYESAFFTFPRDISPNLKLALDLLCYSGVLTSKGTVKIVGLKTGLRYMVHLALLATEKAFSKQKLADSIQSISLTDYREFSSADQKVDAYLADLVASSTHCGECGASVSPNARFCESCGAKVDQRPIISALLLEPVSALSLGEGLKERIKEKFPLVGAVVQASRDELMKIKFIKEVRSKMIKNAADEFISG